MRAVYRYETACLVERCDRRAQKRGMCHRHYEFWRRHGEVPTLRDDLGRFLALTDKTPECWNWKGATLRGYGRFRYFGHYIQAHRAAWLLLVGPIPESLELDHLCRNRSCVNPSHLEPVTGRENKLRGDTVNARNAHKSECLRGHPLSGENLYVGPDGKRQCRMCGRERVKRWRAKRDVSLAAERMLRVGAA